MPLFGNRMIVQTANYKHIQKFNKDMAEREDSLSKWFNEKTERKKNLKRLNDRIRQNSIQSGSLDGASRRDSAVSVQSAGASSSPNRVTVPDTDHIIVEGRRKDLICGRCAIM